MLVPDWYPLAGDRVACVGAPIAVVIANDRYTAEDAAEEVIVDYEPLDAVVGIEAALADGSPLAHPDLGTNRCYEWSLGGGDVEAGLAEADVIVERTINNHLIAGTPMEGRGVVAEWHGDRVTLWGDEPQVAELAALAGTTPYELLTGVGSRVERVID